MAHHVTTPQGMQARLRRAQNAMMEIGELGRRLGTAQGARSQEQARLQQLINQVGQELQEIQRHADRQGI